MQLHGSELKKGVVIERGASPWQIFQQNAQGFAVIRLSGTAHRVRQSFELPLEFSAVPEGSKVTLQPRFMPSRILKAAMDFLAFVMIGF